MDVPLVQELLALASWIVKWEGARVGNWSRVAVEAMAGRERFRPRPEEGNGSDSEEGKEPLDRKRAKWLLTLCLNSDFSSRVMVSALAMTGMMFTTLLRCFMNSRSSGRKLRPREDRNVRATNPSRLSPCSRHTIRGRGLVWEPS